MKTLRTCLQLSLFGLLLACTGCAAIITSGDRTIPVASTPAAATVTVYDAHKKVVATGTTPAKIKLKKGAGYFKGADYQLVVEKTGYQPQEFQVKHGINGWYFGNAVFGGLLGFVVVDPLTGGMWVLKPDTINAELSPCAPGSTPSARLDKDQPTRLASEPPAAVQR